MLGFGTLNAKRCYFSTFGVCLFHPTTTSQESGGKKQHPIQRQGTPNEELLAEPKSDLPAEELLVVPKMELPRLELELVPPKQSLMSKTKTVTEMPSGHAVSFHWFLYVSLVHVNPPCPATKQVLRSAAKEGTSRACTKEGTGAAR